MIVKATGKTTIRRICLVFELITNTSRLGCAWPCCNLVHHPGEGRLAVLKSHSFLALPDLLLILLPCPLPSASFNVCIPPMM